MTLGGKGGLSVRELNWAPRERKPTAYLAQFLRADTDVIRRAGSHPKTGE
jgi:hypothetical protein